MAVNRADSIRDILLDEGLWPTEKGLQFAREHGSEFLKCLGEKAEILPPGDLFALYMVATVFAEDRHIEGLGVDEMVRRAADIMGAELPGDE